MDLINSANAQNIFVSTQQQQSNLDSLSKNALSRGIDFYMKQDFKRAVKEFQRSIGLAPGSEHMSDAANYMANAYLKLEDPENAIKSYKTAIKLNFFRDDMHLKLGNLYFSEERYQEAEGAYREAVRINPTPNNHFSLGQAYLNTGRYKDAENQFNKVRRLEPQKPNGNYGMGLAFSKQGRYEDAIRQFEKAIALKKDFYDAYAEMGYAYAEMGQMESAEEIHDFLEKKDSNLAQTLSLFLYEADTPKMMFAFFSSSFRFNMPANTPVSALDAYLSTANAEKTFTMKFQFDKEMNRESIENRLNWTVARAAGNGPGQAYNFGLPLSSTEVNIAPVPDQVIYDSRSLTATVYFKISQNATADGTLDPSHIEFKFNGKDIYGLEMDHESDQFCGFSGVA